MVFRYLKQRSSNPTRYRVLFICHNAGLTGAPMMLLHLVTWLSKHSNLGVEVLIRESGELEPAFAKLVPTWRMDGSRADKLVRSIGYRLSMRLQKIKSRDETSINRLLRALLKRKFDIVYSNTITNGSLLESLDSLNTPVITHVHEMGHWIKACGRKNLQAVAKYSALYVAASEAVRRELVETWKLPAEKIVVVHEFIPTDRFSNSRQQNEQTRLELGLSQETFVVVGSGVETWRKGKDLFVDLVAEVARKRTDADIGFIWVGGWEHPEHEAEINDRLHRMNLESQVQFIGQVPDPARYFEISSVFAMVSREDPYPLVCLEAASLGKPILCFEGAGGITEFVEGDAGIIVPYLDVNEMANALLLIYDDKNLRNRLGRCAAQKVRSRHDVDIGARQVLSVIESLMQKQTT